MNDDEKKTIAGAITTLVLSDHMGDAHEAGLELARLLWGEDGASDYMEHVDGVRGRLVERLRQYQPNIWDTP